MEPIITLPAGTLIAGRFAVEQPLGAGGMGTVHVALDRETGQRVALKLLQSPDNQLDGERFHREAQILVELRHPHIVSHVAHGLDELGRPYLAMEWLPGEDLRQRLRRGRLGLSHSLALLHGVSAALAEAHRSGVVHRDLKPSNLFLRDGDPAQVVVLDFGVARRMLRTGALTRTGVVVGTPEYMAPEQARGGPDVGPAADVFALGCVLYECLTGEPPFHGEHVAAVLFKVLFEAPPRLGDLRDEVPEALGDLLDRMLRKEPAERFSNGLALHDAVRRLGVAQNATSGSLAPTLRSAPGTLTPQEQQIYSVAVAVPAGDTDEEELTTLASGADDGQSALLRSLQRALAALGARVELLADGSVVATVLPTASASDQALLAARCGLLLKERLPNHEVAVTTGRGLLRGQVPIGESIDRALALVAGRGPSASTGVWIDELSEGLLAGRLQLAHRDGRPVLLREQDPATGDEVRRLLGQPTPCVGREQELAILDSVLSTCLDDQVARAVGVVAPPGMGKSRLRHEFMLGASRRHPELVALLGRGDLMNAGAVYGIVGDALRRLCEICDDEPPAAQYARLRGRIGEHLPAEAVPRVAAFLAELCRIAASGDDERALPAARNDPKVMRDQVTLAFIDWLRAELQQAPVLLVLEDLHWGDGPSVQLLEQALRELRELPLCVLVLARPEVQELFPGFWTASELQVLPLRALSRRACERLAQDVLRRAKGAVDPEVVGRIVAQSAGHPLFLEELVRAVAEGQGGGLPETVLAMLVARLSQLDPGARQVLRAGSVFGETFTRAGAQALLGEATAAEIEGALATLVRAEVIERLREAQGGAQERYKFRHALVRDAAYSLLTAENRALAHRLACAHLEQVGADPAALAEHAHKGDDRELAARHLVAAARQALARFDLAAAERHAERALACGLPDRQCGVVRAILAWTAYFRLDQQTGYEHALAALEALAPGSFWWAKAFGVCFYASVVLHRLEHAERLIAAFFAAEPEPDGRVAFLEAGQILNTFFSTGGQRQACARLIDKLRAVAAELDPRDHGYLHHALIWRTYYLEPDPYLALRSAERATELLRAAGDRHTLAQSLMGIGMTALAIGDAARGEPILREGRALAQANGDAFYSVVTALHLGFYLAGRDEAAAQAEAAEIAASFDDPQLGPAVVAAVLRIVGQVRLKAGDVGGAAAAFERSIATYGGMVPYRLMVTPLYVETLLRQGRSAEARRVAEAELAPVEAQGGLGFVEVPARLALTLARLADGDREAAKVALAEALARLRLRAEKIDDARLRRLYLELPENQTLLGLGREHGVGPLPSA